MNMVYVEIIGYISGALNTFCFLPQVIKIWRTRQTHDLSLPMYIANTTGTTLWLIYGILLAQPPIWIANGTALLFVGSILILKIKHG